LVVRTNAGFLLAPASGTGYASKRDPRRVIAGNDTRARERSHATLALTVNSRVQSRTADAESAATLFNSGSAKFDVAG